MTSLNKDSNTWNLDMNALMKNMDHEMMLAILARRSDIEENFEGFNQHVGKVDLNHYLLPQDEKKTQSRHVFVKLSTGAKQLLCGIFIKLINEIENLSEEHIRIICDAKEIQNQIDLLVKYSNEQNADSIALLMKNAIWAIDPNSKLYEIKENKKYFLSKITQLLPKAPETFVSIVYGIFNNFVKCLGHRVGSIVFYRPQSINEDFIRGMLCSMNFGCDMIEILNQFVTKADKK